MNARTAYLGLTLGLVAQLGCSPIGCDPGSRVSLEPVDATQCQITLESRSSGFAIEMRLTCTGEGHTKCYTIDALTCGGEEISLSAPIAIESCPGDDGWCVDECDDRVSGGNGSIWDTPELLDIEACNTYTQE